ncbi:MAG: cupin domain-containing protein [Actinomycetota bacterium]|nr:cupin domain-containing protein [Actinomycetota bacterium]
MLKGSWTVHYADHDETLEAGDAFYLPPGHVPVAHADSELLMISPTEDVQRVGAVI